MATKLKLVPDRLSYDTVECLQQLLKSAERGDLVGMAFAGAYKGREFAVSASGVAYTSPTYARGMVAALDDWLAKVQNQDE